MDEWERFKMTGSVYDYLQYAYARDSKSDAIKEVVGDAWYEPADNSDGDNLIRNTG